MPRENGRNKRRFTRRRLLGGGGSGAQPSSFDIASAVIHAWPGRRDELRGRLLALPGVEIHAETPDGRFIVTIEDAESARAADTVIAVHRLEGVLAAALVSQFTVTGLDGKEGGR